MVNNQTWMDNNYPKEARNKIDALYIANNDLEGVLDLREFTSLMILNCGNNQLTDVLLPETQTLINIVLFPNPFTTPQKNLVDSWQIYRDIPRKYSGPNDKFRDFLAKSFKLIDTADLDKWIENYDFSEQGNSQYHQIMGKKFHGWTHLDEDYNDYPTSATAVDEAGRAVLSKMAEQLLARCYIKLNYLLKGAEPAWENEMIRIATNFTRKNLQSEFDKNVFGLDTCSPERVNILTRLSQLLQAELAQQEADQTTLAQQLQVNHNLPN